MSKETRNPTAKIIHADPTKDFFVRMITRDILLKDCIFDLLDNSLDGARRSKQRNTVTNISLNGFYAHLHFDENTFEVSDNCGGITLSDAIDYAFHFGRRADAPPEADGGIGLYGIGMKRAIFKIGNKVDVISEAEDACFRVSVDVEEWAKKREWDFEYEDHPRTGVRGTKISISELNSGIGAEFADSVFRTQLIRLIARDYAFFIDKGFEIKVGNAVVPSYRYQLKSGAELQPAIDEYEDDGVKVKIVAGLADELPDDIPEELTPSKVDRFGWFIVCNDRVVLAADKTERTVWGNNGYRVWHPQYNGFAGYVFFSAANQSKLPWTTTKREIDPSSPLYRRALSRMKEITDVFASYTQKRKFDPEEALKIERSVAEIDVYQAHSPQKVKFPTLTSTKDRPRYANINYQKTLEEVSEIRAHLSRPAMTFRDVGIHTFEYFQKVEMGK